MGISNDIKPPKISRIIHATNSKTGQKTEIIKVTEEKEKDERIPVEVDNSASAQGKNSRLSTDDQMDFFEQPLSRNGDKKKMEDKDPIEKTSWLGIILFILLIFVAAGALFYFSIPAFKEYVTDKISNSKASSSSSISVSQISYSVSSSSSSSSIAPTSSSSSSSTATISKMTIKVLNGSGVAGAAETVKANLTKLGYTVGFIGNANSFGYATSMIYYKTGKVAQATEIKNTLPTLSITLNENSTIAGVYDVVVVVGKK
ncbi:MAG: LytR C-terminal domain-containing protein [Candidatus Berkelbacteria bacterium]